MILPVNKFSWDNMDAQSELNLRRKSQQPGYKQPVLPDSPMKVGYF